MELIYQKKSPYDLKETITRFKAALPDAGFGVLWELNFKDKLMEKGFDLPKDFYVFEVCNPSKAEKVLNEMVEAGYFLPCKMAIYQKGQDVFIGLPKPVDLISLLTSDDLLKAFAEEVEEALIDVVERVVKE